MKIGVLGSGSGSNMQAILDAIDAGELNAEIAMVLSDNPQGFILERARKRGIPTEIIDCRGFKTKFPEAEQERVARLLLGAGVDLLTMTVNQDETLDAALDKALARPLDLAVRAVVRVRRPTR